MFVTEKAIRELGVFHFQERDCPLREFIKEVVGAPEFSQYRASEGEIVHRILMYPCADISDQDAFLPRPRSYRQFKVMVVLIEERMAVSAERQRSDTGSRSSRVSEKGHLSDNKPGGAAVEGKQSSKNRSTCLRCGKKGHVLRNCKGRNSSGAVAAIAPNGGPSVRMLDQEDVEARAHRQKERRPTVSEIRIGTIDSVGGGQVLRETNVVKGEE